MIGYNSTGAMAGIRTALIVFIFLGGGFAVILTAAAFFGDKWWLFDYAANFRWLLFWFLLVMAIIYTLTARGIASIVFLVAALVNGWLVVPLWMGTQPAATGEDGIRVVHADLYPRVDDTDVILDWFRDSEADLIIVAGSTADRMEPLTEGESAYTILAAPEKEGQSGIVILGTESWPVEATLSSVHAETVYRITVGANGQSVDFVTTWGDLGSNSKNADRLATRLEAVTAAVESATRPVSVIGNIGATRWTNGMETMRTDTGLRDATEGSGYQSTWPVSSIPVVGGWIGIPLDVVLMTDEITPLEFTTGPDIGAGHLPLTVLVGPATQG